MITLASVQLGEDFYLDGLESAKLTGHSQQRLLGGSSYLFIQPQTGGRVLELGTMQNAGIMGLWCKGSIDALKVFEQQAAAVALDYHGDLYTVMIVDMKFEPFLQNEPESANKSFTGSITLIEVSQ